MSKKHPCAHTHTGTHREAMSKLCGGQDCKDIGNLTTARRAKMSCRENDERTVCEDILTRKENAWEGQAGNMGQNLAVLNLKERLMWSLYKRL